MLPLVPFDAIEHRKSSIETFQLVLTCEAVGTFNSLISFHISVLLCRSNINF